MMKIYTIPTFAEEWAIEKKPDRVGQEKKAIIGRWNHSFWGGNFETDNTSSVVDTFGSQESWITRRQALAIMGTWNYEPEVINTLFDCQDDEALEIMCKAMADLEPFELPYHLLERLGMAGDNLLSWIVSESRQEPLPSFLLPIPVLDEGKKVRRYGNVLEQAHAVRSKYPRLSNLNIAESLVRNGQAEDLKMETVRKIIEGRYPAAKRCGLGDLEWWTTERGRKYQIPLSTNVTD